MPFVSRRAAIAFAIAASSFLPAQSEPERSERHLVDVDSGYVANTNPSPAARGVPLAVWSTVVQVPRASWLRLSYAGVLLSGAREPGGDGTYVKITSMQDGAFQTQHLVHIEQWNETSAYFNGDTVLVELYAQPGTGQSRLVIHEVTAGPETGADTICGTTDDRILSFDNRAARNRPTGCTSWMIDDCNHCFLTAGHCTGNLQVVQFNVPLSTASGSTQNPPPQDQYAVDPASLQSNGGQGVGNDWAYFGVFPNSTTNLTPFQAYGGQTFALTTPPPVSGQSIRITGYGSTSSPISPTWNLVQKTHAGPYATFSGTRVQYRTDTTGGNSGSPVILDGTNRAIGIHTHGGCNSTGGQNSGTGSNHSGLQNALANPRGVCQCTTLTFTYPGGLPALVEPDGSTTIRVVIGGSLTLLPGSVRFHVAAGGGAFQTLVPTATGNNQFDVNVPASACAETVQFWFSAQDTTNVTYTDPENAPVSVHSATSAHAVTVARTYNFNTAPPGWSVINTNLQAGAWERGVPIDTFGPAADYDGSGQCWVTGNAQGVDVDGGPTVLRTETFDLTGLTNPYVRYALWFQTLIVDDDQLIVEASEDGGANWTVIETLPEFTGWEMHGFRLFDHFTQRDRLVVRFSIADPGNNSTTEAAIDAFRIEDVSCAAATFVQFGAGCLGTNGIPALYTGNVPTLGSTMQIVVTNLGSGVAFMVTGLTQQSLPLQQYGFGPGCTLLASTDAIEFLPRLATSVALWDITIPANLSLAGLNLFHQVVELGAVPAVSRGGHGVVQ